MGAEEGRSFPPGAGRVRMTAKKKLIEVALPLEAINAASAREKSIRHGHPSTLHLWWARRPLAACRAVLFAQLVDDPRRTQSASRPRRRRRRSAQRLFKIIEELVQWENTTNEEVLDGPAEIARAGASLRDECDHPRAPSCSTRQAAALHDPFAGGGSIPLEAQRLGLEAYAQRPEPGGGADQQGPDRDPAEVRGASRRSIPSAEAREKALRVLDGARRVWPRTCATTASGCATKPRSASATSTRRSRSRPRWPKDRPDLKPYVGRSSR